MEGIVDRIEEDRVVLELSNRMLIVKKSLLPTEIKEGDFIKFEGGKFIIETQKTIDRENEIEDLFNSLKNKD